MTSLRLQKKMKIFESKDLTNNGLIKIINNTNIYRYKYLNHSSFFKLLQHHASIAARKTKGTCFREKNSCFRAIYLCLFCKRL